MSDDLEIALEIDPDTKKVDDAVVKLKKDVVDIGRMADEMVSKLQGMFKNLADTAKSIGGFKTEEPLVKLKKDVDDIGKGTKEWEYPESHRKAAGMIQAARGGMGAMGGVLGEMVGGPIGAEIGQMAGEMVGKLHGMFKNLVSTAKALEGFNSNLRNLGGTLGPIGAGLDAFSAKLAAPGEFFKAIPIIGEELGGIFDSLAAVPQAFKGILETLTMFARMNAPAQFELFQDAINDTVATIGRTFVPVLELMRDATRAFGDVLANILPSTGQTREALADLRASLRELYESIRASMVDVGPIVREVFVSAIRMMADAIRDVAIVARFATDALGPLWHLMRTVFGIKGGAASTSFGAAARPAAMHGFEEYQRQLQLSAFSQGTDTMASLPTSVSNISTTLTEILRVVNMFTPAGFGALLTQAFRDALNNVNPLGGAEQAAKNAAGWGNAQLTKIQQVLKQMGFAI